MSGKEREIEAAAAVAEASGETAEKADMVVVFRKPYVFEGKEYKEIDLSPCEDLTAEDMIAVNRIMARTSSAMDVMPEASLEYACYIAARGTKMPVEFFLRLPSNEAIKVKNQIMGFLFN